MFMDTVNPSGRVPFELVSLCKQCVIQRMMKMKLHSFTSG